MATESCKEQAATPHLSSYSEGKATNVLFVWPLAAHD